MKKFGLIGRNIGYSFSKPYFENKFQTEGLKQYSYELFDLESPKEIESLKNRDDLNGLNITIPYKREIIGYLDAITNDAHEIEAVNCIEINNKQWIGHNTDHVGFKNSLLPLLENWHKSALILGTGGASSAIKFTLEQLNISSTFVSRTPSSGQLNYEEASDQLFNFQIIINCTPTGTFPQVEKMPDLSLDGLCKGAIVYDLIYNPEKTKLLQEAEKRDATIKNGLEMLHIQAEESWKIWLNKN